MPAKTVFGVSEPGLKTNKPAAEDPHDVDPVRLQEIAHRNQRAGGDRQLLLHVGELLDHLRHHRHQQNADDRDGDHGEGNRVDHRLRQLALHLLALLVVLRQLLQHVAQVAGLFTGHHQRAVELVEGARELAEGVEQGVTFHHLLADLHHHCRQLVVFRLLRDRLQRALERQCGVDQRG